MSKTITVKTEYGSMEVPVKYLGEALAVHKRVIGFDKLSTEPKQWTITHIESGMAAGIFRGPLDAAIKLASTWDPIFKETVLGSKPNVKDWEFKDQWLQQLNQTEPVATPDRFSSILSRYGVEPIPEP